MLPSLRLPVLDSRRDHSGDFDDREVDYEGLQVQTASKDPLRPLTPE